MIHERNAEAFRLIGEIVGDAGAGEDDETDRERFQQIVIATEGRGFGMTRPVRLEDDLRDPTRRSFQAQPIADCNVLTNTSNCLQRILRSSASGFANARFLIGASDYAPAYEAPAW